MRYLVRGFGCAERCGGGPLFVTHLTIFGLTRAFIFGLASFSGCVFLSFGSDSPPLDGSDAALLGIWASEKRIQKRSGESNSIWWMGLPAVWCVPINASGCLGPQVRFDKERHRIENFKYLSLKAYDERIGP